MDRAWTEMHSGSDIKLPRIYRFIIKYVTPLFLVFILGFWLMQDGLPVLLLKKNASTGTPFTAENSGNIPFIIITRVGLILLFITLVVLVWIVWRRRERNQNLISNK